MARRKKNINEKVRVSHDTELLGETIWVGTEVQKDTNLLLEGLCIKEHPVVMVKLDGLDEPLIYTRDQLWIKGGFNNG